MMSSPHPATHYWLPLPLMQQLGYCLLALGIVITLERALEYAATLPYFDIKQVRITGKINEANAAHLRNVVKQELRGNFFTLNLAQTQAKFKRVAWVRAVKVKRLWPRTIEVHIEEHVPIAYWNSKGMVNSKGEFFDAEYDQNLPHFYGPLGREREMTERYLLTEARLKEKQWQIAEWRLSERDSWRMKLANHWQVEFGREAFDERLNRFLRYVAIALNDRNGRGNYFDMRYQDGFALAELSAPTSTVTNVDLSSNVSEVTRVGERHGQ